MNAIGIAGLHGPVRKIAQLTYQATCPNCHTDGALTIHITPAGDRPSCKHCITADVAQAIRHQENR